MPVSATDLPGFPQQDCCLHGMTFYILRRIKLFLLFQQLYHGVLIQLFPRSVLSAFILQNRRMSFPCSVTNCSNSCLSIPDPFSLLNRFKGFALTLLYCPELAKRFYLYYNNILNYQKYLRFIFQTYLINDK